MRLHSGQVEKKEFKGISTGNEEWNKMVVELVRYKPLTKHLDIGEFVNYACLSAHCSTPSCALTRIIETIQRHLGIPWFWRI